MALLSWPWSLLQQQWGRICQLNSYLQRSLKIPPSINISFVYPAGQSLDWPGCAPPGMVLQTGVWQMAWQQQGKLYLCFQQSPGSLISKLFCGSQETKNTCVLPSSPPTSSSDYWIARSNRRIEWIKIFKKNQIKQTKQQHKQQKIKGRCNVYCTENCHMYSFCCELPREPIMLSTLCFSLVFGIIFSFHLWLVRFIYNFHFFTFFFFFKICISLETSLWSFASPSP